MIAPRKNSLDEIVELVAAVKAGKKIEFTPRESVTAQWVRSDAGGRGLFNFSANIYRVAPEVPDELLSGHKASGLKVGDTVRITMAVGAGINGWNPRSGVPTAIPSQIGRIGKIVEEPETCSFVVAIGGLVCVPYFAIKKVKSVIHPWSHHECIDAVGTVVAYDRGDARGPLYATITSYIAGVFTIAGSTYAPESLTKNFARRNGDPCGTQSWEDDTE